MNVLASLGFKGRGWAGGGWRGGQRRVYHARKSGTGVSHRAIGYRCPCWLTANERSSHAIYQTGNWGAEGRRMFTGTGATEGNWRGIEGWWKNTENTENWRCLRQLEMDAFYVGWRLLHSATTIQRSMLLYCSKTSRFSLILSVSLIKISIKKRRDLVHATLCKKKR